MSFQTPEAIREFVNTYRSCTSLEEVMNKTGMKKSQVQSSASKLRTQGVVLPKFKSGRSKGVALDKLDSDFLVSLNQGITDVPTSTSNTEAPVPTATKNKGSKSKTVTASN